MTPYATHPDEDVLLRYVSGDLPEPEQSAFEDHLFGCDTCLGQVERLQAVQYALAARDPQATTVEPIPFPTPVEREAAPARSRAMLWTTGAVAAVLVAGVVGTVVWRRQAPPVTVTATAVPDTAPTIQPPVAAPTTPPEPTPSPEAQRADASQGSPRLRMAVVAMVTPPPYLPLVTRDAASSGDRFDDGMKAYLARDWATAARVLAEVDRPQARFYKGVADLMRGASADASTALQAVRASGQEPWATESLFYLGKAAVQRGDVAGARQWFAAARDARSSQAREASRLLAALDELP